MELSIRFQNESSADRPLPGEGLGIPVSGQQLTQEGGRGLPGKEKVMKNVILSVAQRRSLHSLRSVWMTFYFFSVFFYQKQSFAGSAAPEQPSGIGNALHKFVLLTDAHEFERPPILRYDSFPLSKERGCPGCYRQCFRHS